MEIYSLCPIIDGFLIAQPMVLPGWAIDFEGEVYLLMAGVLICLGGLGLNRWGRTYLGKYFVESTEIQQDHTLINTGPYHHIRHPIYSSLMTIATGLLLVNPSIWMGLATIYAYVDFSLAARRDEKLLSENLPGYAQYMTKTPRFIPQWNKRND
ncbi:MAG: isoprenylcysteine carboxylmethyltransferase family protein [Anaerolineae bacterium]|nr:isoprenylcysteine carboxylmethyltransferase family protein [Anaerolineae bacterium]